MKILNRNFIEVNDHSESENSIISADPSLTILLSFFFTCLFIRLFLFLNTSCIPHHYFFYRSNSFQFFILSNFFQIIGGGQQLQNICRQRFRILKIIQVEPYLIADVEYGISGRFVYLSFYNLSEK